MKALIFDFDGVIADTFEAALRAYKCVFHELGYKFGEEFLRKRFVIGAKNVFREFFEEKGLSVDEDKLSEFAKKKSQIQLGFRGEVRILPGVYRLLEELEKRRFDVALASTNTIELINPFLIDKDIQKYFKVILTSEDVSSLKPEPDIFLKAAEKLKVPPHYCAVFEDSIQGIRAAKKAGMKSIAVATGPFTKDELKKENPDLLLDSLNETDKIMKFMEAEK